MRNSLDWVSDNSLPAADSKLTPNQESVGTTVWFQTAAGRSFTVPQLHNPTQDRARNISFAPGKRQTDMNDGKRNSPVGNIGKTSVRKHRTERNVSQIDVGFRLPALSRSSAIQ